jgi:hypothetical protein
MATPWWEFCATEMLMRIVVWAAALATKPAARVRAKASLENFMSLSPG